MTRPNKIAKVFHQKSKNFPCRVRVVWKKYLICFQKFLKSLKEAARTIKEEHQSTNLASVCLSLSLSFFLLLSLSLFCFSYFIHINHTLKTFDLDTTPMLKKKIIKTNFSSRTKKVFFCQMQNFFYKKKCCLKKYFKNTSSIQSYYNRWSILGSKSLQLHSKGPTNSGDKSNNGGWYYLFQLRLPTLAN